MIFNSHKKYTNNKKIVLRFLFIVILFLSTLTMPYWIPLSISVFFILFFGLYEGVLTGIIIDIIYTNDTGNFLNTGFFYTTFLLILISMHYVISKNIRTTYKQ